MRLRRHSLIIAVFVVDALSVCLPLCLSGWLPVSPLSLSSFPYIYPKHDGVKVSLMFRYYAIFRYNATFRFLFLLRSGDIFWKNTTF